MTLNNSDNKILTNYDINGNYRVFLSKKFQNWEYRLMDFITYHQYYKIDVSMDVSLEDLKHAKSIYKNTSFKGPIRIYEDRVLTHSTTANSWEQIKKTMLLKSWNRAKNDGDLTEDSPIGSLLKDPVEFRDFIMLGGMDFSNEIVVMCKQRGELIYDGNIPYHPGARIYIDANKLANEGLLLRDGIHIKVKDVLSLTAFMIDVITKESLLDDVYTPITFTKEANRLFLRRNFHKNTD